MTIPLKDPKPMTTCPTCKSPVRVDHLDKHIRTKHSAITPPANYSKKPSPPATKPPTSSKKKMATRMISNTNRVQPATKRTPVKQVYCPYCIWYDLSDELPSHIRISHPLRYAAWLRDQQNKQKPDPAPKDKVEQGSSKQLDQYNVKCPLCDLMVLEVNYSRHLNKHHPGKTIYSHPPLPVYSKPNTSVTSVRRATGGVKQPIAMGVLNVGRRSKGYIKRK